MNSFLVVEIFWVCCSQVSCQQSIQVNSMLFYFTCWIHLCYIQDMHFVLSALNQNAL